MAELPTQEELEKLYHEKGHDALVWYIWRNTLRALPTLGYVPIQKVWRKNAVGNIYSIFRVVILLAQWKNVSIPISIGAASTAEAAANAAADMTKKIRDASPAGIARATARAANAVSVSTATTAATIADAAVYGFVSALPYDSDGSIVKSAAVSAARADFILLQQKERFHWSSPTLWKKKQWSFGGGKPKKVIQWERTFLQNLHELELDFLANDLDALWRGELLGSHAINYLQDLSDSITNNPRLLHRAILGGAIDQIHAVRALLLGAGGAGKSSLADCLQGKVVKQINQLTIGVDYQQHQPLSLHGNFPDCGLGSKKLDLFLWDFGGQTIFHGLHSAFLHENCVYVLVVDSRHEQAPDEWLHQIRHLAGSQAKVLLVTNWYEQCETYQNKTRLLREFPDLLTTDSFFYFSCIDKDAPDFKRFVQSLVKASLDSQKMVLKETLDVQRALDAQYKDGDTVFVRESKLRELIAANIQDAK